MKSYFLLSRQIFESAIWQDDPHILKLFIYLIGQSRYDKKPKVYPNCKINRGELVTSLQEISENNHYLKHGKIQKWSRQKVARMLEVLTKQGYILLISDTYGTHVRICNYEQYQDKNSYKREISDSSGTHVERNWNACGTQLDTTKQDKAVKQDKQDSNILVVFNFWNEMKIITHKEFEKLIPTISAKLKIYCLDEIRESIKNYSEILKSNNYWFTYKWTLKDFFQRGFDKFLSRNKPFDNYKNRESSFLKSKSEPKGIDGTRKLMEKWNREGKLNE